MTVDIIIITLQIAMVLVSLFMIKVARYQFVWILVALTAILKTVGNIIQISNSEYLLFNSVIGKLINFIPIINLLLILIIFILFYRLYKSRELSEITSLKDNLLTLSTAIEQSPSIVVITDLQGNIEYVNPKFTEQTGYEKDEVIGRNPRILKSGHFHDNIYKEMWKTISTGGEWRGEFHNKKKNGNFYWESASISSIKDSSGKVKHYLAVKEDITERKKIEDILKKSEKRLMDVQRVAHIGTWEWDSNNNEAFWSDENYRIMGFEPGEIEASHELFQSFIHPDDKERVFKAADKSRADHKENSEIFRIILRDGTVKYVNDWSYYSYDNDGKLTYSTGMMQDITFKVESEKKLKSSLEEKKALLRELYHRTKNNMQVISAMLNLSASRLDDDHVSEVFTDLDNRIQSMSLVHEKLYQSQNLSSINLKEYITDLCSSLLSSYYRKNCDVSFKFSLKNISVSIDAAIPLGLIINELVSNSFKHAFTNRNVGEISINLITNANSTINIEIADNGIGAESHFDITKQESIGLQTVISIAENQLHGILHLDTDSGFRYSIEFSNDIFKARV
ncbi:MAG: PAS domain S-box protein [Spirochaetales bacterium]|nr:PAS domain S-box protein [Spirochaetales bacterium]